MTIADLHIHSRFSRATSKDGDAAHLDLWARRKGIHLVGTGDFTHPAWRAELKEQLFPAEDGFFMLREDLRLEDGTADSETPRFVLSAEISNIYKKNGRVRKVHNVIILPGLEEAEALSRKLEAIGNVHSDGRPILGMDSKDLLEITLETCPKAIFIPAHIWTPHFSLFGAFSGFDTIEECFEDLTPHIHALETGLSSDPPMNWRVSALDRFTLVSHSDAHSPQKLGREADLLDCEFSYDGLYKAIQTGEGFMGTLEFFPEEGKYHLDGHRNCQLCLSPAETAAYGGKCPVCGKKITIGVEHRVEELVDRPEGAAHPGAKPFESLVPLPEVIAASTGMSAAGNKTQQAYLSLLEKLGPEFRILREIAPEDIERAAGPCIAEGIRRLRRGEVDRKAGYDGEYGVISLLTPDEIESLNGQTSLFGPAKPKVKAEKKPALPIKKLEAVSETETPVPTENLNAEQRQAAEATEETVAVVAGPGTGKTKTLVSRIAWLVEEQGVKPSAITAVTFTNQAASEMRERLEKRLGGKRALKGMTIGTFHAICLKLLGDVRLIGEQEAQDLAREVLESHSYKESPRAFLENVSKIKCGILPAEEGGDAYQDYCRKLQDNGVLDFDDLLLGGLRLAKEGKTTFPYLLVDEFQDVSDLQYQLALHWSRGGRLFVIGDPDQAIYGFRGASGRCFGRLREERPALREIFLHQNYRSTPEILGCALPMISKNEGAPRILAANQQSGPGVRLVTLDSDFSEGIFIAKEIARMTGGVDMLGAESSSERTVYRSFSDIAVLCRTHRQADLVEKCLRHDSIPCVVVGREDFLDDDGVRGIICFFRSLLDMGDLPSLGAALRFCFDCPPDLISAVTEACRSGADWEQLRGRFNDSPQLTPWFSAAEQFLPLVKKEKPHKLLTRWMENRTPSPAMEKLINMAVFHSSLPVFLDALLLGTEGDLRRASGKEYASGAVRLMTLHGAKGLEFPAVFLAGVRAGMLPLESGKRPADPAEERRLFYVGMTRAREELLLLTSGEESPFLRDIPQDLLVRERESKRPLSPVAEQLSLF